MFLLKVADLFESVPDIIDMSPEAPTTPSPTVSDDSSSDDSADDILNQSSSNSYNRRNDNNKRYRN